jgi:hypothetical protein
MVVNLRLKQLRINEVGMASDVRVVEWRNAQKCDAYRSSQGLAAGTDRVDRVPSITLVAYKYSTLL